LTPPPLLPSYSLNRSIFATFPAQKLHGQFPMRIARAEQDQPPPIFQVPPFFPRRAAVSRPPFPLFFSWCVTFFPLGFVVRVIGTRKVAGLLSRQCPLPDRVIRFFTSVFFSTPSPFFEDGQFVHFWFEVFFLGDNTPTLALPFSLIQTFPFSSTTCTQTPILWLEPRVPSLNPSRPPPRIPVGLPPSTSPPRNWV